MPMIHTLETIRTKLGYYKHKVISEMSDIAPHVISDIKTGKNLNPSYNTVCKISAAIEQLEKGDM